MRHAGWTITQIIHKIDRFFVACRRVSPSFPFLTALSILAVALVTPGHLWAAASPYLSPATSATQWLSGHQNGDGSWGSRSDVKLVYTAEAVQAMAAANERGAAYWRGIAWLQNQAVGNIDHASRRILALASHGDNLADDLAYLQQVQNLAAPATGAWGLTEMYESGALDTALALQAMASLGQNTNVNQALSWLKANQLSDKGWSIGQNTVSDPLATAQVILALKPYTGTDSSLSSVIANAAGALNTQVTTGSPARIRALAALALVRAGQNPSALLASLVSAQAGDGGIGNDILQTALAGRAFAAAAGADLASLAETVGVNDLALRQAINEALGRNALDSLNKAELAKLTTLNIAGRGVSDLTGLEWATSLTTLDARDNQITSTAPIDALHIANLDLAGNPISGGGSGSNGDVPLPAWSLVLLGASLFGAVRRRNDRFKRSSES